MTRQQWPRFILFVAVACMVGNTFGTAVRYVFDAAVQGGSNSADQDGDGHAAIRDCNDANAEINPGAQEVCDGIDNDCDGAIDAADSSAVLNEFCFDGNRDGKF